MFRLYVWMDGEGFDPVRFREAYGGEVSSRRRISDGLVKSAGQYWQSAELSGVPAARVEDELRGLLRRLEPALKTVSDAQGMRIVIEVVQEYRDSDSVAGLFLSAVTLRIIAGMRASVDLDIVRDLS